MIVRIVVKLLKYSFNNFIFQHHGNQWSGHFVITTKADFSPKYVPALEK